METVGKLKNKLKKFETLNRKRYSNDKILIDVGTQFENENIDEYPLKEKEYYNNYFEKSKGFTLLMKWCMMTGLHPELVDKIKTYIKNHPEEINKKTSTGTTALMLACWNSYSISSEETVKILIEGGADINATDHLNRTALFFASVYSRSFSTENTVKILIDAKADVNITDKNNWSPLIGSACYSNDSSSNKTVKMLISAGAKLNIITRENKTALQLARNNINSVSSPKTVKILENAGAV